MFKVSKRRKIILWIVFTFLILNTKNIARVFFPINYQGIIYSFAEKYEVDPYLICGIIKAESNFKPDAVSSKKARGLMQITEPTARWIAEKLENPSLAEDFLDPGANIEMGTFYISYLMGMYNGNEKSALAAYNAGFNVVDRWLLNSDYSSDGENLTKIPYRETELYVTKVLNNKQIYDILYNPE